MAQSVTFNWNKSEAQILKETLKLDTVQLFIATEWARLYNPFVPMQSGYLANDSVNIYVDNGIGISHHMAVYSRRQYFGSGFNFSKEKHPLASAMWDQAAKSAGKGKILVKSTQDYIDGKIT